MLSRFLPYLPPLPHTIKSTLGKFIPLNFTMCQAEWRHQVGQWTMHRRALFKKPTFWREQVEKTGGTSRKRVSERGHKHATGRGGVSPPEWEVWKYLKHPLPQGEWISWEDGCLKGERKGYAVQKHEGSEFWMWRAVAGNCHCLIYAFKR